MNAHSPLPPLRGRSRLDRELDTLSTGHRNFFRLVIGVTRVLFVLLWPLLWAAWFLHRAAAALTGGGWPIVLPAGRPALDPPPDWTLLDTPGNPLYVVGAGVALVLGLVSTIGMCFWPFIAGMWVLQVLPAALAQGTGAALLVALGALGAALLEAAMLGVYFRHVRDGLAGR